MLNEQPALSRQLSALNGLTSHLVELRKVEPLPARIRRGQHPGEIDAVLKSTAICSPGSALYSMITITPERQWRCGGAERGRQARVQCVAPLTKPWALWCGLAVSVAIRLVRAVSLSVVSRATHQTLLACLIPVRCDVSSASVAHNTQRSAPG